MNTRLKQFLDAENISQSQFADTIRVVRASVSHVLSGRNNPSYEFIKAIMTSYPQLNMEWLMLGKGKMYKSPTSETTAPLPEPNSGLLFEEDEQESDIIVQSPTLPSFTQTSSDIDTSKEALQTIVKQRNVSKIIIMFDDGTFQEM